MDEREVAGPRTRPPAGLEKLLRRDRIIVLAGVGTLCLLAWSWTVRQALRHDAMTAMAMPQMQSWGGADLLTLFVMWVIMMVAMMLPSATPMILTFAAVGRQRRTRGHAYVPTGIFLLGYLLAWFIFSAVAAGAQWGLHYGAVLSPAMRGATPLFGGVLLLTAGAFQWTPLKRACLAQCRSPLGFLTTRWREGTRGALRMGTLHGVYCVGCCWLLMTLLFVAGVMNLLWVAAIAAFVVVEKLAPPHAHVDRVTGLVLAGWGLWLLL